MLSTDDICSILREAQRLQVSTITIGGISATFGPARPVVTGKPVELPEPPATPQEEPTPDPKIKAQAEHEEDETLAFSDPVRFEEEMAEEAKDDEDHAGSQGAGAAV